MGHSSVGHQVDDIIATAREAAERLQREVEEETARRAAQVRLAAEDEAARIRHRAEADAEAYLQEMRRRVDAWGKARLDRMAELSDGLVAAAESVEGRLGDALRLRDQLEELLGALGRAAEEAAKELDRAPFRLPRVDETEPPPTPSPAPPAADVDERVREVASELPRPPRRPTGLPRRRPSPPVDRPPAGPDATPSPPSDEPEPAA